MNRPDGGKPGHTFGHRCFLPSLLQFFCRHQVEVTPTFPWWDVAIDPLRVEKTSAAVFMGILSAFTIRCRWFFTTAASHQLHIYHDESQKSSMLFQYFAFQTAVRYYTRAICFCTGRHNHQSTQWGVWWWGDGWKYWCQDIAERSSWLLHHGSNQGRLRWQHHAHSSHLF